MWPATGRYGDTLDYATYGPDASAFILAHRTSLDLLDKIAVTAGFITTSSLGNRQIRSLWENCGGKPRQNNWAAPTCRKGGKRFAGVPLPSMALWSLPRTMTAAQVSCVLKNALGTQAHRFVVLHDIGDPAHSRRRAPEIEHLPREPYIQEVLRALRVARSAIQMLALSISQHEQGLAQRTAGLIGSLASPTTIGFEDATLKFECVAPT